MQQPPGKKRIEFIDLLRGWAVIVMIQTHVFNATLSPGIRQSSLYDVIRFIDGLVAPAFLFASGMAYAVTTRRKINDYLSFGWPLFRQLGRLIFLMLLGYSLHIPKFNYYDLRYETADVAWQVFWQSDVLQCIAVSLLFLQVMLLLLRSERRLYMTMLGVTAAVVFATPVCWGIDFWTREPILLASFMNGNHYSVFPVFPWSAFLFAGALCGYLYLRARDRDEVQREPAAIAGMMSKNAWIAVGIMVASFLLHPLAAMIYPTYDYWKFSPSFFMLRLGLVMLIAVAMYSYEHSRNVSPRSVVALMGRESLLVYATHLMLVYGKFGTFTFTDRVQQSFGYGEAAITACVLFGLMYVLALAWSRLRTAPPLLTRATQGAVLAGFVLVFFFGPR